MKRPQKWIRAGLLTGLVAALFINWFYYEDTYQWLQTKLLQMLTNGGLASASLVNAVKLMGYTGLVVGNMAFSLLIVYTYFLDGRITRTAARYLLLYFAGAYGTMCVAFLFHWAGPYQYARLACDMLASPLVECTLIPLMRLKQAEDQA
ncbi:MAG: hypothetical protein MUC97_05230 [Bernardetiaceae bacterium]|nr:hypothetical protein [Bernardetiaceae bacterium]